MVRSGTVCPRSPRCEYNQPRGRGGERAPPSALVFLKKADRTGRGPPPPRFPVSGPQEKMMEFQHFTSGYFSPVNFSQWIRAGLFLCPKATWHHLGPRRAGWGIAAVLSVGASGKALACQCKRHGFNPWVGKIPWRRAWQPTPVLLPGESHGPRSLAGYSP